MLQKLFKQCSWVEQAGRPHCSLGTVSLVNAPVFTGVSRFAARYSGGPLNPLFTKGLNHRRRMADQTAVGTPGSLIHRRLASGVDLGVGPLYILRATMICRRPAARRGPFLSGMTEPEETAAVIGGSSNGRTTDSDSVYLGSNPSPPASLQASLYQQLCFIRPHSIIGIGARLPPVLTCGSVCRQTVAPPYANRDDKQRNAKRNP